ncbi:MAG: hypothetical protein JW839_12720 [Candidatus Lokiarchaeota archaeon]|nr:hypothetical protein [Candidatus Lokiarchaeota archaeon]
MSPEPDGVGVSRDRRAKIDDLIVVTASVALFIGLDSFVTRWLKDYLLKSGVQYDARTGLAALVIVGSVTIAFGWILARGLRWRAARRPPRS